MIIAGTGHRPDKLGGYTRVGFDLLTGLARDYLQDVTPSKVISGMALGWDQALAQAAVDLGIPYIAAVPFDGFDRVWPWVAQRRLAELCDKAEDVEIVSPYPGAVAMQLRNEWMVDRADRMVALWNGGWGGTFNCIQYAHRRKVPVDNLWDRWDSLAQSHI